MPPYYPTDTYDRNEVNFPYPNEEDTLLTMDSVNFRDDEIKAIEQALGEYLVPTGTVSLSSYVKMPG